MELSSSDQELMTEINEALVRFIKSEESDLQLEPMNSYRRRMVHKVGTEYGLTTESTGEGDTRSVHLSKTEKSKIPENLKTTNQTIDRGIEIFNAKPGAEITLRNDGSFGVAIQEKQSRILDQKVVPTGEFRIRNNKIVCPEDSGW